MLQQQADFGPSNERLLAVSLKTREDVLFSGATATATLLIYEPSADKPRGQLVGGELRQAPPADKRLMAMRSGLGLDGPCIHLSTKHYGKLLGKARIFVCIGFEGSAGSSFTILVFLAS